MKLIARILAPLFLAAAALLSTPAMAAAGYYQPTATIAALKAYGAGSPGILHARIPSLGDYDWKASCPGTADDKVYVAATGVVSGCWANVGPVGAYTGQVQQVLSGNLTPDCLNIASYTTPAEQAAVIAGTSSLNYTPILLNAISSVDANHAGAALPGGVNGTNVICFGPGKYNFSTTVNINHTVIIRGAGGNGQGGFGYGTQLVWPTNVTGIIVNTQGTINYTTDPTLSGGDGSLIEDVGIMAINGSSADTIYGVWCRARCTLRNVTVGGFGGDQIHIAADTGGGPSTKGNANGWSLDTVSVTSNAPILAGSGPGKNGVVIRGADTNAGSSRNINAGDFPGWCVDDESFLGNTHIQISTATCGKNSLVTRSGHIWLAAPLATTTQLGATTPGTDGSIWQDQGTGSGPAAWVSSAAGVYYAGGPFSSPGLNARTVWIGPYAEGNQPPGFMGQNTIVLGGLTASGIGGGGLAIGATQGSAFTNIPWTYSTANGADTTTVTLGGTSGGDILSMSGTVNFGSGAGYRMNASGGEIYERYGGFADYVFGVRTGVGTTAAFGGTTAVPLAGGYANLLVGDGNVGGINFANWRIQRTCSSSPSTTTMARGNICWNRSASAGSPMGWMLTTSGSPDTYAAMPSLAGPATSSGYTMSTARLLGRTTASTGAIEELTAGNGLSLSGGSMTVNGAGVATGITSTSPTAGIGYAIGAGGTVTQATSRTTGVTNSKVTGNIVVLSAAGSATPFTFTVTNTTVALADTVSVSVQKGTTDKYRCDASVAAGSFDLTCADLTGTTIEPFTVNFNVIKGAAS